MVLNWSWLRMVIISNWPGARSMPGAAWTVKLALPVARRRTRARAAGWAGRSRPARARARCSRRSRGPRARCGRGCGRSRRPARAQSTAAARPASPAASRATIAGSLQQVGDAGGRAPARRLHHAHRVLDRDELRAAGLHVVSVRPRHGRISACSPVTRCDAVQLGRDVRREPAAAQRRGGVLGVRRGREEVAAQARRRP